MDGVKILIVEDEDFVRESLMEYLEIKGYESILSATKGEEAIAKIEQEKPDLVLLDIKLADETNGMMVLERARKISPKSKVVMMSAYHKEYGAEAKRLGAHSFIKKPINVKQIQGLLKEIQRT